MKRTIALKLTLSQEQSDSLLETQKSFAKACNQIVPFAIENRCRKGLRVSSFEKEKLLFTDCQAVSKDP